MAATDEMNWAVEDPTALFGVASVRSAISLTSRLIGSARLSHRSWT